MELIVIVSIIVAVNYFFTFFQIRYYRKSMDKLINKYRGKEGYYLFSGQYRKMFKSGSIAILIVNEDYVIQECQVMKGLTVLASFKEVKEFEGQHVRTVLENIQDKYGKVITKKTKIPAMSAALKQATENALVNFEKKQTVVS